MLNAYHLAQQAIADLKAAVHITLKNGPDSGMSNAEIGRTLGIYMGHVRHEGHISRTILSIMESEGVVQQNKETKRWVLKSYLANNDNENNDE